MNVEFILPTAEQGRDEIATYVKCAPVCGICTKLPNLSLLSMAGLLLVQPQPSTLTPLPSIELLTVEENLYLLRFVLNQYLCEV